MYRHRNDGTFGLIGILILIGLYIFIINPAAKDDFIKPPTQPYYPPTKPGYNNDLPVYLHRGDILIANWNLQIFGQTKASNTILMNKYASIMKKYDIIFVQEIRDSSGEAFQKLCKLMQEYECTISSRAGRSTSKEQVGVIHKKNIEIKSFEDYNPDTHDRWERPPIKVTFQTNNYTFIAYNIHVKPDNVLNELEYLEQIVTNTGNVVVLGDLNADCTYYSRVAQPTFINWEWIIDDYKDTTVGTTDCAYDRIILNQDMYLEYVGGGVYTQGITSEMSDHYLVWIAINPI